ncbi:uncharacterized protein BJ171DRAFT_510282 [Polychytrium aggregatum]|uniref:uncharacterized protein n=1 Tax=Polychytrium aggregatum TaxID=110093 RepID=UPI0022FF3111|nr:uncharacterized protein BJ171DRAFT_510282 [Polychytrium aggregatum]KAI9203291.1 hypothetical protein BJ171DRAFT_510282 [Polychytrium aggregatum]
MTPHEPVAQAPARIQSCDSYTHEMPADSQAQVHFSDACQDGCTTLYPENARATQSAHRLHHQTHPHPHHPFHQSQFDGCHSGTSGLPFPVDNSQYTGAPTRPASEPLMPPSPSPDLSSLPSPQSTIDDDFGASPLLSSPTSSTEVATEVEIGSPRPYECPTCHIRFQRRHDLNRHCNIHSKERPFFCSRCQRRFVRRDALRRHQRMKNETRRFRCVATPQ